MTLKLAKMNFILIILVVFLAAAPVFLVKDSEFGGADDQAVSAISNINENYKPWFEPFWEPPGAETASMLFALQASIGSGVLFYFIGFMKGKKEKSWEDKA